MSDKPTFTGNLVELRRPSVEDRAELEDAARARVDGRTLRRKGRTEQLLIRTTPARRQQVERLARELGLTFAEVVERGLDLLEAQQQDRK